MVKSKLQKLKGRVSVQRASAVRPVGTRHKKVRFLIVCEGEKTEPNYFKALVRDPQYSVVVELEIRGVGRSTVSLVEEAERIRTQLEAKNGLRFDSSWVVFDEDGNTDFNKAIALAASRGLKTAWSNEAFELWYYLHFEFLDSGIDRYAYIEKINNVLRKKMGDRKYNYKKNDSQFYTILGQYGDESFAKKCARNLRRRYSGNDYTKYKPCTTVDLLVEELEHLEMLL